MGPVRTVKASTVWVREYSTCQFANSVVGLSLMNSLMLALVPGTTNRADFAVCGSPDISMTAPFSGRQR